ncbi:hypothetical protein PFICI_14071 [Pestalotiopsis fici W106-1]|uniref:Uncharacterized protein n=1 Tax=Pestalotiopsis fici (strain W106-1 / CGMCC3.15140) TaxID=1229662 RepID=W3WJV7_PESFW|nr:uncharacterized protein PFICI_14071 [Pestalotiopsis fici W106-1]ETS74205.1 hypothetical protein PFICI_14071 [Pestalotiopsis fici W106-1]
MAAVRTYILAPNLQFKPSGPIQLCSIIADPFRPTKTLSTLPQEALPPMETIKEYNHELSSEKGHLMSMGFWAQFLSTVGGDASLEHNVNHVQRYDIDELETRYIRDEPSANNVDLVRRLAEPKVQAAIKAGLFGSQPVYMITGIKIARGLTVRLERSTQLGGGFGPTVPVTESVSVGGQVVGEHRNNTTSAFRAGEEDIVFAYQLHAIRRKGRKKETKVDVFESEAALLHGDDGPYDSDVEGASLSMVNADDLFEDDECDELATKSRELAGIDGSLYMYI